LGAKIIRSYASYLRRANTGKYCFGRTPLQTFEETLYLAKRKSSL